MLIYEVSSTSFHNVLISTESSLYYRLEHCGLIQFKSLSKYPYNKWLLFITYLLKCHKHNKNNIVQTSF